jgi:murein DD-endopeptidase MepM/ murein hydrolase activator NlpD
MRHGFRYLVLAGSLASACTSGLTNPSPASAACEPSPASANGYVPLFGPPFSGAFPTGNFFDHDKPVEGDANGYVLTLCGARDSTQVDGHNGYDWRMPEGTPLLAVADGTVLTAGLEPPRHCEGLNRTVQALLVQLQHVDASGREWVTIYGHLSRIDVITGIQVRGGSVIGLSGNTGCSGTPHLHFAVATRVAGGGYSLVDPYGWHGATADPWALDSRGTASTWLWREGAAPSLR